MASFTIYANKLLPLEGGYHYDNGKHSSRGITLATYRAWRLSKGISTTTIDDIKRITISEAKEIYKTWYWDALMGDFVKNQAVAEIMVDGKVNGGFSLVNLQNVIGSANKGALLGKSDGYVENSFMLIYATSNRRHLLPRDMMDNERSTAINPGEAVEEKVSLSDRFGLWLGFHKCSQDEYLEMVFAYCAHFGLEYDPEKTRFEALEWATTRGSRSGRTAWQFIQDLAGRLEKRLA